MKTKTQFKQHNNKNVQPKKDNKKAKRVLLLLIITIIFSFILTVANTLALFVHVFKDKPQEGFNVITQEQQTAPPNYEYNDTDVGTSYTYYAYGMNSIIEAGYETVHVANYFMFTFSSNALLMYYMNPITLQSSNMALIGDIEFSRGVQSFSAYWQADGGGGTAMAFVRGNSFPSDGFDMRRFSIAYVRYSFVFHSTATLNSYPVTNRITFGIEIEGSPIYDYSVDFSFSNAIDFSRAVGYGYGQMYDTSDYSTNEVVHAHYDYNPCILVNYQDLLDFNTDLSPTIIELRRQIEQLQNSTNQQVQDAYNQGKLQGEDIGYRDGYRKGQNDANTYTFSNVIGALIDGPVNAVMSLFDFEVLGVNLRGFFLSLITCAIVIAIIKIFM